VSLVTSVRLGQRMVYALGADLFAHVQRLSGSRSTAAAPS